MNIQVIEKNGKKIAVVHSREVIIADVQSALDFIATIGYDHDSHKIALNKEAIAEEFFRLSTGFAGEIMQKFVNYNCQFAIVGDFSGYTSKPLKDFIYESNKGRHIFFVGTKDEAIEKLGT